jgi:hypothetical protein
MPLSLIADFTFHFQPRWSGASPFWQLAGWLICLVPLVLVTLLYRAELNLVRPVTARLLLGVRLASVAAVVLIVAFQPVIQTTRIENVRGKVVMAVDRSGSMAIADPQRPLVDKLRIARALHLVSDLCSDRQLDQWIQQAADSGQVGFPREGPGTDSRQQQAFDQVCQRMDALTRGALGSAVLSPESNLVSEIEKQHDIDWLAFASSANSATSKSIDKLSINNDANSDLASPLERVASSAGDVPPVAVVLLSDGRHNATGSPGAQAAALGQLNVPVHCVILGSRVPPTDAAIARVQAPSTVFKGAEAAVEATIQVNGLSQRMLTVELQRKDQPPIVETIEHPGGSKRHTVRIPVKIEDAGAHSMSVRLRPEPEDTHPENDSRNFNIQAADDRARVLLIDGEARWELHYLATALARDPSMTVDSVVFSQPRLKPIKGNIQGDQGLPAQTLPLGPDALDAFDAVVLGDVSPAQLTLDDRARIDRYVSDRGGTLIVLAGKRTMPGAFFRPSMENDPLRKLLPIESIEPIASVSGFPITLTADGLLSSFLQLGSTSDANAQQWRQLPSHYWGLTGKAKPGATVLATTENPPTGDAAGNAVWEKDHALFAWHNVGFGRVLYIGIESTWRFRLRAGDALHHQFWGQVLRWAASDQPLIVGNKSARFGPRKSDVLAGDEVEFGMRWLDVQRPLPGNASVAVRIVRKSPNKPDEPVLTAPMQPSTVRPREWQARLRQLPAGEYAAELVIPDRAADLTTTGPNGAVVPLRAQFRVTGRESQEMADLSCDVALLEELAAKSGGRVFAPENVAEIAPLLANRTVTRETKHDWRLAESWPTLALLLILLGFEWSMRKWAGLP